MTSPITHATSTPPVTPPVTVSPKKAAPQPSTTTTTAAATVQISSAAQALLEATETKVQTAKEAQQGDRQAQKLLAKQVATKV